jgi:hypothetical protein
VERSTRVVFATALDQACEWQVVGFIRIELHDSLMAAQRRQATREAEGRAIWRGRWEDVQAKADSVLIPRITSLEGIVATQSDLLDGKDRELAAVYNATSPSFGVRLLDNWELVLLGVAVGVLGWEVAR